MSFQIYLATWSFWVTPDELYGAILYIQYIQLAYLGEFCRKVLWMKKRPTFHQQLGE